MSLRGNCRTLSERMDWIPAIRMTRLTTIARTGRRMKRSVNFILAVLRPRRGALRQGHGAVHLDRRPRAQLEDARAHDHLPGLDAAEHGDEVAARGAEL